MVRRNQASAYHEAGHAVVAVLLARSVQSVKLHPGTHCGKCAGRVRCTNHPRLTLRGASNPARIRQYIEREIIIAWAGLAAESLHRGRKTLDGAGDDAEMITALLRRLEPDAERRTALGRNLFEQTVRLLKRRWSAVRRVAEALVQHGFLTGAGLRRAIRRGSPAYPPVN